MRGMSRAGSGSLLTIDDREVVNYSYHMVEVRKTSTFLQWLMALRDLRAVARIQIRIDRVLLGNFGDVKPVGEGVSELRIDYGPGYRVYFTQRGKTLVLLLCGGDKSTQKSDIAEAKSLGREWTDGS